ncbi:MAG: ABC transporter substrate-binding protein [Planctomycetota bacterium]
MRKGLLDNWETPLCAIGGRMGRAGRAPVATWAPWLLLLALASSAAIECLWGRGSSSDRACAGEMSAEGAPAGHSRPIARRIVTLAPSLTETAAALGLTDRLVGVTRYCDDPPEVTSLPKVGGYFDVNFEAIVSLQPDMVLLLTEHEQSYAAFSKLRLPRVVVSHQTVDGILESIPQIGAACGAEDAARTLVADIRTRLNRIAERTAGLPRPRVLLVVDRAPDDAIRDCYVAGTDDYFERIIELAGGQNACRVTTVRFPVLAAEGIVWMDPDVIVDLSAALAGEPDDVARHMAAWRQLPRLSAVRQGRVHPLVASYAFRPSPRVIELVERLSEILHPGALAP